MKTMTPKGYKMKNILTILLGIIIISNLIGTAYAASEDEEYDLMFHADGSLRDPVPGDGYTASQNYWILVWTIVGVFFVWAGWFRGIPFFFIGSWIFFIIVGFIILFVW